jgi:hypothetical protein
LSDCFLFEVFPKQQNGRTFLCYFFTVKITFKIWHKKWVELHFGRLFKNSSGHPGCKKVRFRIILPRAAVTHSKKLGKTKQKKKTKIFEKFKYAM